MPNKLITSESLVDKLSESVLLVDSTALIDASRHPVFMEFLVKLSSAGCNLMTIPSVIYEFERGAKSSKQLKTYGEIFKTLGIATINNIEIKAQNHGNRVFTAIYNIEAYAGRKEKGPSYTDSLLCLALYVFRRQHIKLLTSNYNDVPLSMFNRDELIMFDTDKELRTAAIYTLSPEKLSARAKEFIKRRSD